MRDEIKVLIASLPDREYVVAEIWINRDIMWGEISQETGELLLTTYADANGESPLLSLDDVIAALIHAKGRLVGGSK